MLKVLIESPFGGHPGGLDAATKYAKAATRYAIDNGACPMTSHLLYPLVLDERKPDERKLGLQLGREWLAAVDEIWCFVDFGASEGMQLLVNENYAKDEDDRSRFYARPVRLISLKGTEWWPE